MRCAGFRKWLQVQFHLGIPICWGRGGTLLPHRVQLGMEIGKPIPVEKVPKDQITDKMIDDLHQQFCNAMVQLFNRTKVNYSDHKNAELNIL